MIIANTTPAAPAAKAATATIPIVFVTGGDAIALGLVASFNRPGANVTGSAPLASDLPPKRLQLLRDLIPNASLFGVLADPAFPPTHSTVADLQAAARTLGLQLVFVNASTDRDLEAAFASFSQQRVGAVLVGDSTFYPRRTPGHLKASSGKPPDAGKNPNASNRHQRMERGITFPLCMTLRPCGPSRGLGPRRRGRCGLRRTTASENCGVGRCLGQWIDRSTLATALGKLRAKPTVGKNQVSNALARS